MSLVLHKEKYMVYFTTMLWAECRMHAFHESGAETPEDYIRLMYICKQAMEEILKPEPDMDWIIACGSQYSRHMNNVIGQANKKDIVCFPFTQRNADPGKTLIGLN